jgi:hypothetical protein
LGIETHILSPEKAGRLAKGCMAPNEAEEAAAAFQR